MTEWIAGMLMASSLGLLLGGWIRQQRRHAVIRRRLEKVCR